MLNLSLGIDIGTNPRGFSPSSLFAASEPGGWYDPSDLTTLFQDSAGTTPVTAAGQSVGLWLDKSRGLVLGSELRSTGTVGLVGSATAATYNTSTGAGSVSRVDASNRSFVRFTTVSTAFYSVTIQNTGGGSLDISAISGSGTLGSGQSTSCIVGLGANFTIFATSNGTTVTFTVTSVKELPGNHLSQSSSSQRAIYGVEPVGGRRNLLTYTEQFDNAVWGKTRATLTQDATTAPDGTLTADRLEPNATHPSAAGLVFQSVTIAAGATVNGSFYLKAGNATWAMLRVDDNGATNTANIWFNIATGAVGTTSTTGSGVGVSNGAVVSVGNGWYRCSATFTTTAATTIRLYTYAAVDANGSTASTLGNFAFIWGAQLETGSTATAYQRVVTAFDVTEAGVPSLSYIQFDGSDDGYVSPTITPGIDKAQVFAGVRKLSDVAGAILVESGISYPANAGSFYLSAPNDAATQRYGAISRGSSAANAAQGSYVTGTGTAPDTAVLAATYDISGDQTVLRRNGTGFAAGTADQGTGNFLAYPLYVGRRGGSSLPYNGRIYGLVVRFGANLSASTITQTETWMNQKTGAY